MAKKKAATAGTGHFVMLKADWPPAGFRRTVHAPDGDVVLKFTPGETVKLTDQEFEGVKNDIGPALVQVESSPDARRPNSLKAQPANGTEPAQEIPKATEDVAAKTLTPLEQLNRIVFLCDVLQGYPESAARLAESKRARDGAFRLYHHEMASTSEQHARVNDAGTPIEDRTSQFENRRAFFEEMETTVARLEAASDGWVDLLNEFFAIANQNKLNILKPAFNASRSKRRMPHRLDSFDWSAFVEELLSVRDEASRKAAELADNATGDTKATKSNRIRSRNRRPAKAPPKKLTDRQSEVLLLYGECKGNMSEVARRMGVTHPTAMQHYNAANTKLGITASERARTIRLRADHLG